jgi:hypothetical protein
VRDTVQGRSGRQKRHLKAMVGCGLQAISEAVLAGLPVAWSWLWQWGCILLALGLALAVPAAVIYFGTDLHDQLAVSASRYWHLIGAGSPSRLTGRCIELGSIIVLSALPAPMFLQLDRTHITTLADRWKRETFRLDPTLVTESDYTAKCGRLISEVHTSSERRLLARLAPTRRSPILVATVVIAAGWIFTLVNQPFRAILATIADSEWITMLWNWRHSEFANADCARMRWIGADGLLRRKVGRSERTWEPWHTPLLSALPSFSGTGWNHPPEEEPRPAGEPPGELVGLGGRVP